jgi:DNA-binding GntR family transcriptional regulator
MMHEYIVSLPSGFSPFLEAIPADPNGGLLELRTMVERPSKSISSALKRPQHLSLVEIAYNVLLEAIVNQEFEPKAQISIDSLAKQLNMSNTPVREALMRAKGERLVEQKTNHGFVVSGLLTSEELHHLFDVRHLLETYALNSAVASDVAVQELGAVVEQMRGATDGAVYVDYKDYLVLDHQFHRILVGLAQNSFLLKAWEDLHVHLHLSRLYTGIGLFDRDDSLLEHQRILEALQRNDRGQAVTLLSQHIKRVVQRVAALIER